MVESDNIILDEILENHRRCLDVEFMMLAKAYSNIDLEQFKGVISYANLCGIITKDEWDFLYDAAVALKDEYFFYFDQIFE